MAEDFSPGSSAEGWRLRPVLVNRLKLRRAQTNVGPLHDGCGVDLVRVICAFVRHGDLLFGINSLWVSRCEADFADLRVMVVFCCQRAPRRLFRARNGAIGYLR